MFKVWQGYKLLARTAYAVLLIAFMAWCIIVGSAFALAMLLGFLGGTETIFGIYSAVWPFMLCGFLGLLAIMFAGNYRELGALRYRITNG